MNRLRLFFAIIAMLLAQPASGDELRPGYLQLRETGPGTYNLLFKIPARGEDLRLAVYVKLPEGTQNVGLPRASFSDGAYVERRSIRREGGLAGQPVSIEGLSARRRMYWFGSKALPAQHRPNGFLRRRQRSLFMPCLGRERWLRLIWALASNTSCSASTICFLSWRW